MKTIEQTIVRLHEEILCGHFGPLTCDEQLELAAQVEAVLAKRREPEPMVKETYVEAVPIPA